MINCGDNSGAKNLYIIAVTLWGARLNRLPAACVGDFVLASVKKGKPELRKKGACAERGAGGMPRRRCSVSLSLLQLWSVSISPVRATGAARCHLRALSVVARCNEPALFASAAPAAAVPHPHPPPAVHPAIVIRQRKTWRRKDGTFIYFEDNAGVIVNPKGELKGSAITGPVAKECADMWPRISSCAPSIL